MATSQPLHPFYPLDAILDGYVQNTWGLGGILLVFGIGCLAVMVTTSIVTRAFSPSMRESDQACVMWFVVCMAISVCLLRLHALIVRNSRHDPPHRGRLLFL